MSLAATYENEARGKHTEAAIGEGIHHGENVGEA